MKPRSSSVGATALVLAALAAGSAALAKPATDVPPRPEGIRIEMTEIAGPVYADQNGRTLYVWGGDEKGVSKCGDERYDKATVTITNIKAYLPDADKRPTCATAWPPLTAQPDAAPAGAWTIIGRTDGSKQWAYKGMPVYRSTLDEAAGDVNGLGLGIWTRFVGGRKPLKAEMGLPPGVTTALTKSGRALATDRGSSLLYVHDNNPRRIDASTCGVECRSAWRPFMAPAMASQIGDWSAVAVGRGLRQWSYKGRLLFSYVRTSKDDQLKMDEVPGWTPAVIQPLPPRPADITISMSPVGEVYASPQGKTLYVFDCSEETPDRQFCDVKGATQVPRLSLCGGADKCRETFRPLLAGKGARAPGRTWTIVKIDKVTYGRLPDDKQDGLRAWAYRGRPVYTFAGDVDPGDAHAEGLQLYGVANWNMIPVDAGRFEQYDDLQ